MLYCPKQDQLWDCWIVPSNEKLYMFYLSITDGKGLFNSISLAISDDGVHFTEFGPVLRGDDNDQGWGTGMVQKIGNAYIMNYSITKNNEQVVHFAKSYDLINWQKLENTCRADGINYMRTADCSTDFRPRWDSLGIIDALEDTAPPYYGFITATAQNSPILNRVGALGLLTSNDGLNWKCLPNAFENCTTFPHFEVPEHFELNGRHYVIFCTSSYLGHNFYKKANYSVGGTFYVVSENALGKYRMPPNGDCILQGTCDNISVSQVSVGRPLKLNGNLLYYHIWGSNSGNGWFGTIKKIVETAPYTLALEYCEINNLLFGKKLEYCISDVLCRPGKIYPVDYSKSENTITINTKGTSNALAFLPLSGNTATDNTNLSDGRIITSTFDLKNGSAGFYFEQEDNKKIAIKFNIEKKRLEIGYIFVGWATCVPFNAQVQYDIDINNNFNIMLFARKYFIEVYINDRYAGAFRTESLIKPNNVGIYAESTNCKLTELIIREMQ